MNFFERLVNVPEEYKSLMVGTQVKEALTQKQSKVNITNQKIISVAELQEKKILLRSRATHTPKVGLEGQKKLKTEEREVGFSLIGS